MRQLPTGPVGCLERKLIFCFCCHFVNTSSLCEWPYDTISPNLCTSTTMALRQAKKFISHDFTQVENLTAPAQVAPPDPPLNQDTPQANVLLELPQHGHSGDTQTSTSANATSSLSAASRPSVIQWAKSSGPSLPRQANFEISQNHPQNERSDQPLKGT